MNAYGTPHDQRPRSDLIFDQTRKNAVTKVMLELPAEAKSSFQKSVIVEPQLQLFDDLRKSSRRKSGDMRNEWQGKFQWDMEVNLANRELFGNESFRENQREIINATKSGKDVLALIPTGGGKSLTFQLSAVTDNGVTIVVMPLLSLIEDNLSFVLDLGIDACSLSVGGRSKAEERRIG